MLNLFKHLWLPDDVRKYVLKKLRRLSKKLWKMRMNGTALSATQRIFLKQTAWPVRLQKNWYKKCC